MQGEDPAGHRLAGCLFNIPGPKQPFCLGECLSLTPTSLVFQFHGDGECRVRGADGAGESRRQLQGQRQHPVWECRPVLSGPGVSPEEHSRGDVRPLY